MNLYTIGCTRRSAEAFFGTLRHVGCDLVVDVRLNNTSQLSGFTKRDDMEYFLREICDAEYVHEPMLAPTKDLLVGYRKGSVTWQQYQTEFYAILSTRSVEARLPRTILDLTSVLLCSEFSPQRCHRRLVAEYLQEKWGGFDIVHL